MDLLQTQTSGNDLIICVIVLSHLSTMRHCNVKLSPVHFFFPPFVLKYLC